MTTKDANDKRANFQGIGGKIVVFERFDTDDNWWWQEGNDKRANLQGIGGKILWKILKVFECFDKMAMTKGQTSRA